MNKENDNSLKQILINNKISAKKRFGQNFLHDKNIIKQIVKASKPKNKNIVEVGPGPGLLTKLLLDEEPKSILAIETDKSFTPILDNLKNNNPLKFNYLIKDILKIDLKSILDENYSIVSNLPYNISVPFIVSLVEQEQPVKWETLTLTVQKEVADRMLARVNTKQYGRLSVLIDWRATIEKICDIKPTCFIPEPKVMSTVIRIKPRNNINNPNIKSFQKIVSAAFGFRRKTLKRSLGQLGVNGEELANKAGIDPKLRAQNLTTQDFCNLSKVYEELKVV